jgi:uncharacterized HAD superfamily protein
MKREQNYKTIFSDIDGTLIEQVRFEDLDANVVNVLPGVAEKMNEWYEAGHHIVLTTARPWNLELITKQQMEKAGIRYHQIVMGIGREERILINNNSSKDPQRNRAFGVPVLRDGGFENLEWASVGL